MKKLPNFRVMLAIVLSIVFVIVSSWNELTRPLGSYWDPDETRIPILDLLIVMGILSLILFGLIYALQKRKIVAEILWVVLAPALWMLSWDMITKNLVENGRLAAGWLTDSAYAAQPGAAMRRNLWIISGILFSLPYLYGLYMRTAKKNTKA